MGKKIIPIHKNHKQDLLGNNMSCTLTFGFCSFKFLFGLFFFFNFSLNFLPIYSSISKRWKFQSLPILFSMVCELIIKWDSCWSYLQFKSGYKGLIGKGQVKQGFACSWLFINYLTGNNRLSKAVVYFRRHMKKIYLLKNKMCL